MRIKARNHLFIFKKSKVKAKYCNQCKTEFKFGDLIYSKRHERYYCKDCTIKLHLLETRSLNRLMEKLIESR